MEEQTKTKHVPVMTKELVDAVGPVSGGVYVDCTLGGAGHLSAMIEQVEKAGVKKKTVFIGIDQDQDAINRAAGLLIAKKKNIEISLIHENFENLANIIKGLGIRRVNAIWADLGTSEDQLVDEKRGFSFLGEADLDMRMDKDMPVKAADLVNGLSYKELIKLFTDLADLGPVARRISKEIVESRKIRPILTTKQLVEIIRQAVPRKSIGSQPFLYRQTQAKLEARVFQALRIAVNHEFDSLKRFLPQAFETLNAQGKLVVISFHSGEDRIVKHYFVDLVRLGKAKFIEKQTGPGEEEIQRNQRSSSAKFRAIEKL